MESIPTTFSNTDEQIEIVQHGTISWFALISAAFSLLSITALLHPAFWIFPCLAVVTGLGALRSIRIYEGVRGRGFAIAGLSVGLFFGSWAISSFFAERWVVSLEAREFSDEWLRLVLQGRIDDAHQMMIPPGSRKTAGQSLQDFYAIDAKAKLQRDKFFGGSPVKEMLALGKDGRVRFNRYRALQTSYENRLIEIEYDVVAADESVKVPFVVNVQRTPRQNSSTIAWQIVDVFDPAKRP